MKSVQAQWQKRQRITPFARDCSGQGVQPLQGLHFTDCSAWRSDSSLHRRQSLKALTPFCRDKKGADFARYRMHCQPLVQALGIGDGAHAIDIRAQLLQRLLRGMDFYLRLHRGDSPFASHHRNFVGGNACQARQKLLQLLLSDCISGANRG